LRFLQAIQAVLIHLRFPLAEPARLRVVVFFLGGRMVSGTGWGSIVEEAEVRLETLAEKADDGSPEPEAPMKASIGGVR
jgi:hypothetical protein